MDSLTPLRVLAAFALENWSGIPCACWCECGNDAPAHGELCDTCAECGDEPEDLEEVARG